MPLPTWDNDPTSLKDFLDKKANEYESVGFIHEDPISVPHQFSKKQDIEIAGFLAAIFAWGQRVTIINKTKEMMRLMDKAPYDFIINHGEQDLKRFEGFRHRTFQTIDCLYFIDFLRRHFAKHDSLEDAFCDGSTAEARLRNFHRYFFDVDYAPKRTQKHIATPERGSTCKRLNMFLRWMVRPNTAGVDFGIWKKWKASELMCPLDVHVERVARSLGLLTRKQRDWRAVEELTDRLRSLDPQDPVKYDFALFGIGVMEKPQLK
jgi:uncharacterized protein (TIGR02757 family)